MSDGFNTPVDIGNRALQHVGTSKITTFQDDDKGAAAVALCYDGLRKAELRRNVWRFAVRRAILYPINTAISGIPFGNATTSPTNGGAPSTSLPTLLLEPPLYDPATVYAFGAIVTDANGAVWVSLEDFNIANVPGALGGVAWDSFFGSMCVQPYDTTGGTAYWVGDLVYTINPNGGTQVFVSMSSSNSANPSTPNVYSPTQTYQVGDVVQDAQGFFWQSNVNLNTNNQPGVYGPWSSAPTYTIGALVIGTDRILYQALVGTTNVNPAGAANPTDWLAVGFPGSWPVFNLAVTYAKGAIIAGYDGNLYQSLQNSNVGQQPVGAVYNPSAPLSNWWMAINVQVPWNAIYTTDTCNGAWRAVNASLKPLQINYPAGTGPSYQSQTRNIFMLPAGYLRDAPQDPKAGSVSYLGAPSGLQYTDWVFDGNYIISRTTYPIMLRFVADVTLVDKMDDMFCEGLGCRIGLEICEELTQKANLTSVIEGKYKQFMGEARVVNGIEEGATEPPEDDYITCRI